MKKIVLCLAMMGLAGSAIAASRAQLNDELQSLTAKFTAMEQNPKTCVPARELAAAKGIVLLDTTKGGFVFAYHHGYGVALVRESNGHWSPPAFITSNGASLGFQAGGEEGFYVMVLTSRNAADDLTQQTVNFGAGVGGTANNESAHAQVSTVPTQSVMVYSQKSGYFGGAAVKGGQISADNDADSLYYGKSVSMKGILFDHQVHSSNAGKNLIAAISRFSR